MTSDLLVVELQAESGTVAHSHDLVLRVTLLNQGDIEMVVNKRLAVNHPRSSGDLSFTVKGPDDQERPLIARVNVVRPDEDDYTRLDPWTYVGRRTDIASFYDLGDPGLYDITATYRDHWEVSRGAWRGEARSNSIEVGIG